MLSDEEKNAIERLNKRYEFFKENPLATNVWLTLDIHNLGIALNLIEKQSKEIEELKNITKSYDSFLGDEKIVIADKKFFVNGYFQENFVRKDKIKEKMQQDIYTNEHTILGGRRHGKTLEYGIRLGRIQMCEEQLEERN